MYTIRQMVSLGLQGRAEAGIRVRQPLPGPVIHTREQLSHDGFKEIIEEELNVKSATYQVVGPTGVNGITMNFEITPELKAEGVARELVRYIQNARKKAGLQVDDRILLGIYTDNPQLQEVTQLFSDYIFSETLATGHLKTPEQGNYQEKIELDGQTVNIALSKA